MARTKEADAVVEYVKLRLRKQVGAKRGDHAQLAADLGVKPPSLTKQLSNDAYGRGPSMDTCLVAAAMWKMTKEELFAVANGRSTVDLASLPAEFAEEISDQEKRGTPVPVEAIEELAKRRNQSGPAVSRADWRDAIDAWRQSQKHLDRILGPKLENRAEQSDDF